MHRLLFLAAIVGISPLAAHADWTSYRGPSQNGVSSESVAIAGGELRQLWKTNLGIGTLSVVVSGALPGKYAW